MFDEMDQVGKFVIVPMVSPKIQDQPGLFNRFYDNNISARQNADADVSTFDLLLNNY